MALTVSLEQAAANALRTWLAAQFADATVSGKWPGRAKKLPQRAITVLIAGPLPTDEEVFPEVVDTQIVDATHSVYTWRIACGRLPLQLDMWASSEAYLDDMCARMLDALNTGMGQTIGAFNAQPFRSGVVLPMGDGWTGNTDCVFDYAERQHSPEQAQVEEWRATCRGTADVNITLKTTSPRLVSVKLKVKPHESDSAPAGMNFHVATITANGVVYTEAP